MIDARKIRRDGLAPVTTAGLSLAVGMMVLGMKYAAYWLTGSVSLYSDALESIVNVVAAAAALAALKVSRRPADANHPFGHTKVEYFSAVLEGALIMLAAVEIVQAAWGRFGRPLRNRWRLPRVDLAARRAKRRPRCPRRSASHALRLRPGASTNRL